MSSFPDTTLVAFATDRPTSRDALLGISGVGQSKLERYMVSGCYSRV
jgi:ATP-dependent DNA helicase RecQ